MNARKFAEVGLALMSLYVLSNVLSYIPWWMRYAGLRVVSTPGSWGAWRKGPPRKAASWGS